MPTPEQLRRLCIVLVRARDPNNIGAVARAMHDFGFIDLRLVSDYPVPYERARSAIDAADVLTAARQYASVAEATADCTLVVGTTAVGLRRQHQPLFTLADAASRLRSETASPQGRLGLLFGSEKTGLSNVELSHCHWLLTIPMHPAEGMRHASMNLGQAVAVCLYEMIREVAEVATVAGPKNSTSAKVSAGASAADLERLTELLLAVMEASEYSRRHPANIAPTRVRQLVLRMALDRSHALAWSGILRQLLWKLQNLNSPREASQPEGDP